MEKIVKEFNIYEFDELNNDIKEKVIENIREDEIDLYCEVCLYDDMFEKCQDLVFEKFGIKNADLKLYYDLSYSQGAGAMFEMSLYIEDINKKYNFLTDEELKFVKDYTDTKIKIRHDNGHYYHKYSFLIDYNFYNYYDYDEIKEEYNLTEEEFNNLEEKIDTFLNRENTFYNDIVAINNELTEFGYNSIEYFYSDNAIKDIIYNRELKFYKDGCVFNG